MAASDDGSEFDLASIRHRLEKLIEPRAGRRSESAPGGAPPATEKP